MEADTANTDGNAPPPAAKPGDVAEPGTPGTGENTCPTCRGSGKVDDVPCPTCRGTGVVIEGVGGA